MLTFTNDDIRHKVKTEEPGNVAVADAVDSIDFLTFPNLEQSVKDDVNYLKGSKLLKQGTHLSGWIYDVTNGKVCWTFFFLIKRKSFLKLMFCGHRLYLYLVLKLSKSLTDDCCICIS